MKSKVNLKRLFYEVVYDKIEYKSSLSINPNSENIDDTKKKFNSLYKKGNQLSICTASSTDENIYKSGSTNISDYLENILESNKMITMKEVDQYLTLNKENVSIDTNTLIKYVKELEEIQTDIRGDLKFMKEREINRVGKEFLSNDYERIYRVNINTVFSVIVGQQHLYSEMKKFLNEKQNYYRSLELCRNFNVFNKKYEKIYTSLFNKNKEYLK